MGFLSGVAKAVGGAVSDGAKFVGGAVQATGDVVTGFHQAAGTLISGAGKAAGGLIGNVASAAGNLVGAGVGLVYGSAAGNLVNGVIRGAGTLAQGVVTVGSTVMGGVVTGIGKAAGGILNGVGKAINFIGKGVGGLIKGVGGIIGGLFGGGPSKRELRLARAAVRQVRLRIRRQLQILEEEVYTPIQGMQQLAKDGVVWRGDGSVAFAEELTTLHIPGSKRIRESLDLVTASLMKAVTMVELADQQASRRINGFLGAIQAIGI